MILTHILVTVDNCKVWVWRNITAAAWHAMPHVPKALVIATGLGIACGGVAISGLWPPAAAPEPYRDIVGDRREIVSVSPFESTPVPEPASLLIFGSGLAALAWVRRR